MGSNSTTGVSRDERQHMARPSVPTESLERIQKKSALAYHRPQLRYREKQWETGGVLEISAEEGTGSCY